MCLMGDSRKVIEFALFSFVFELFIVFDLPDLLNYIEIDLLRLPFAFR